MIQGVFLLAIDNLTTVSIPALARQVFIYDHLKQLNCNAMNCMIQCFSLAAPMVVHVQNTSVMVKKQAIYLCWIRTLITRLLLLMLTVGLQPILISHTTITQKLFTHAVWLSSNFPCVQNSLLEILKQIWLLEMNSLFLVDTLKRSRSARWKCLIFQKIYFLRSKTARLNELVHSNLIIISAPVRLSERRKFFSVLIGNRQQAATSPGC